jgi:hypothetical protein
MTDDEEDLERSEEPRRGRDMAILKRHVAQLCEHFDAVQVVATRVYPDGTMSFCEGGGNYYARVGAVRSWLMREDAMTVRDRASGGGDD